MARLSQKQKLFVCRKIAERNTYARIIELFQEKYGFPLLSNQIHYMKERAPNWKKVIEEMRTAFDIAVSDLALSSKRVRLEMAHEAFRVAEEAVVTERYDKHGNLISVTKTKNPSAMVQAVRHGKEEMEGKNFSHHITGKMKTEQKFIVTRMPPPDPLPDDIEEDD